MNNEDVAKAYAFMKSELGQAMELATPERLQAIIDDPVRFKELAIDLTSLLMACPDAEVADCVGGALAFLVMCKHQEHSPWKDGGHWQQRFKDALRKRRGN